VSIPRLPLLALALLAGAMGAAGAIGAAAAAPASAAPVWSVSPIPSPHLAGAAVLSSVSCPSARACIAVGYEVDAANTPVALVERWTGTRWAIEPTPALPGAARGFLFGVSCATPRSCTAVGSATRGRATDALVEHWNGARWSMERAPAVVRRSPPQVTYLAAVACPSATACTAVGYAGNLAGTAGAILAARWTAARGWVTRPTAPPPGASAAFLSGVSCPSAADCTAVGFLTTRSGTGAALAERWTQDRWRSERIPTPLAATSVQLTGVSCPVRAFCTAVGYFDTAGIDVMLAEHWDGARWVIGRPRYPRGARAVRFAEVSCPSLRSCTAVGFINDVDGLDAPLAEHWTPRGWAVQPTPAIGTLAAPADAELSGVSCPMPARCVAVGDVNPLTGTGSALAETYR
jgi:hypothetical protein